MEIVARADDEMIQAVTKMPNSACPYDSPPPFPVYSHNKKTYKQKFSEDVMAQMKLKYQKIIRPTVWDIKDSEIITTEYESGPVSLEFGHYAEGDKYEHFYTGPYSCQKARTMIALNNSIEAKAYDEYVPMIADSILEELIHEYIRANLKGRYDYTKALKIIQIVLCPGRSYHPETFEPFVSIMKTYRYCSKK